MSTNPLIAAYKKPAVYVALPSEGKWYDPKPKLSVDNELAIYPMSAKDELITKTPDALFNGEATVALIESCCPDIPNPRQMPVNDLLVVLLAIRQASYGNDLSVDIKCTECGHINQMAVDSNVLLSRVEENTTSPDIKLGNGFKVSVSPYNIQDRTRLQVQQVKQNQIVQGLMQAEQNGQQIEQAEFGKSFVEIAELTVELVSNCIVSVQTPEEGSSVIQDPALILEWIKTITRKDYDEIRDRVEKLSENNLDTMMNAECQECQAKYKTNIE